MGICFIFSIPSLPKSSKYLLRRCLEPLKAFSGGVWGFKHLLIRYLEDQGMVSTTFGKCIVTFFEPSEK